MHGGDVQDLFTLAFALVNNTYLSEWFFYFSLPTGTQSISFLAPSRHIFLSSSVRFRPRFTFQSIFFTLAGTCFYVTANIINCNCRIESLSIAAFNETRDTCNWCACTSRLFSPWLKVSQLVRRGKMYSFFHRVSVWRKTSERHSCTMYQFHLSFRNGTLFWCDQSRSYICQIRVHKTSISSYSLPGWERP